MIQAMPERKRFFFIEAFPYTLILIFSLSKFQRKVLFSSVKWMAEANSLGGEGKLFAILQNSRLAGKAENSGERPSGWGA